MNQLMQHQARERQNMQPGMPAKAGHPGNVAFDYPAAQQPDEPALGLRQFDAFQGDALRLGWRNCS